MRASAVCVFVSMVGALALASPAVHAQRGGGHGGGMSGGMGGGYGGGMSSGMQRGGSMGTMPGERPSERMGSPSQQDMAGDRQSRPGGPKTAGDLLQQNGKLSEGLAKLLPAGTDLQAAASGFRNLGEFVAAVHVSNNLGIPFDQLKDRVISGDSLGAAIHALRPSADAQVEARKAHAKAEEAVGSS